MILHIFNPDHDIALAMNQPRFTAPHAGRQLRSDLGFLPALWAERGDIVIVEDVDAAQSAYRKLKLAERTEVRFVTLQQAVDMLRHITDISFAPWGWNITLRETLRKAGFSNAILPTKEQIDAIREISHRRTAVELLARLRKFDGTVGQSKECKTYEDVIASLREHEEVVVKAPWSSSGRGVRYVTLATADSNVLQWIRNTIERQGSVIVEQKCRKVMDFAMEFTANADGSVQYDGLSLFTTAGSAYTGNALMKEEDKEEEIQKYVDKELLNDVIATIEQYLAEVINKQYVGPLGVDMMICATDSSYFLLNPCIEVNLRRTMGHVALALSRRGQRGTMNITYEGKAYKIKL